MKNNTIKLTESRLRSLVEACVKEALEDTLEEGFGMDTFKGAVKDDMSDTRWPSWEEFMELVNGEPNEAKHMYNKLMYNQAKSGHIDPNAYSSDRYAEEATWTEPGMKGKARRGAMGVGMLGKMALDKGKAALKNGFNKSTKTDDEYNYTQYK